jgi:hypothetical protein
MAADSPSRPSAGLLRRKFEPLLAVLLLSAPAAAQEDVSMKLDLVAWGDSIGGLSLKSPKGNKTITAKAFTYSEPVAYSGSRLVEIHQSGSAVVELPELPGTEDDEAHQSIPLPLPEPKMVDADSPISAELAKRREKEPTLVALAALPANSRRATILLAPAAQGTYRAYVIDDDPSKLPVGSVRVHNLAPLPILMRFSNQKDAKELKPGENFGIKPDRNYAAYRLAYREGEEWIVQENNMIPVAADKQIQFIVLKSDNRFFLSADGASGGFLQSVTLTRDPEG